MNETERLGLTAKFERQCKRATSIGVRVGLFVALPIGIWLLTLKPGEGITYRTVHVDVLNENLSPQEQYRRVQDTLDGIHREDLYGPPATKTFGREGLDLVWQDHRFLNIRDAKSTPVWEFRIRDGLLLVPLMIIVISVGVSLLLVSICYGDLLINVFAHWLKR